MSGPQKNFNWLHVAINSRFWAPAILELGAKIDWWRPMTELCTHTLAELISPAYAPIPAPPTLVIGLSV
ncbi:hypothetical protein CIB48_g4227 [Xylaria polymorpha]|nr:hypothetical protein CIB48_g4227 [Xylaria polymorpha]